MLNQINRLRSLYEASSKHSGYQTLAKPLEEYINVSTPMITRHESARMEFISQFVDFQEKSVVDIGGNTGYFSFGALAEGARNVEYFDGNRDHADFVKLAANLLQVNADLIVHERYFDFNIKDVRCDVMFLLNVLHHIGEDFGDPDMNLSEAKREILKRINSLASVVDLLVFQMGFCWKGNVETLLFDHGTKSEMLQFIGEQTREYWSVLSIGIAESRLGEIIYLPLDAKNIWRDDHLGEFLNRPIFILKSK